VVERRQREDLRAFMEEIGSQESRQSLAESDYFEEAIESGSSVKVGQVRKQRPLH